MTQNGGVGAIPAPWKDNGPIPAPWKVDQQQQQQLNAKEIQPQGNVAAGDGNDDGKAGRKRAAADTVQKRRESVAAKRAKSRRGAEVDNSCSDDDEPAKNLNASAKLVNDDTMNITSSPPGVPMAHSTPLINNSAATNRSAFSVLQPMHPNQQPQPPMGHHYPPGHPGNYFFPPTPADSMFHQPHHPQNPYFMPWPRGGPAMGYGNPFMMGMGPSMGKMEPLDMDNRWTQLGGVDENFGMMWPGGFGQQKQPQRRETQRGKTAAKKTNNKANATDSGLGDDILDGSRASVNSILSTNNGSMDGSFANDANNSVLAPPPIALPLHPINSYETYCTVPGRLTLLSNLKKYRVSIAEIQRRLSPPECLNASILGGILRKAKNKDGGRLLREQLLTYGVELTSGRRKQGPLTCFSSLVEEEAAQIALDFSTINQKNYPNKEAATFALCDVQNAQDAFMCQRELYYASKFLNRMLDFHRADRSPVADMPMKHEELGAELGPEIQQGLTNYSLLTHGFGGRVVQTVLDSMLSVLNECSSIVNRNYPQGQGNIFTGQMGGGAAGPSDGF